MVRGAIHDLVQWIFTLEQENARLLQEVADLKKQLEAKKE